MKEVIAEKGITKSEMIELLSVFKKETAEMLDVMKCEMLGILSTKKETIELQQANKNEMIELLAQQFEMVYKQIDLSADNLRIELKSEIGELRKDMNQRFTSVDKRLSSIENSMVYSYEHMTLVKRVEKLEV